MKADPAVSSTGEAPVHAISGPEGHRLEGRGVGHANSFLEMVGIRGLSRETRRAYAFDLVALHRWLEEAQLELATLDYSRLLGFIEYMQRKGAQPATINRRLTTCELFYSFVNDKPMERAPELGVAPHYKGRGRDRYLGLHLLERLTRRKLRVKMAHKVVEPLGVGQVAALLRSLRRYRDLAIVYLMLLGGLRSGEVLALRLSDVERQEQRLRIRGKGKRERLLPMAAVLSGVIADYLRLERPGDAVTEQLFVVLQGQRRGQPMTPAGLRRLFRHRRATGAGLTNANAHRLRHTFGADMARAGVRLPILQRMMGHADGKTTLQYVNLSMTDVAAEYARAIKAIETRYQRTP